MVKVRGRGGHRAVILAYHCVAVPTTDPHRLCVTPQHFAEHLEVLRQYLEPMPLSDLSLERGIRSLPRRAAIVTLDDGYANNLHMAKPLLARYAIPAAVFIVSGAIGIGEEFWWDELERLLLQPGIIPSRLCLTVCDVRYEWACDGAQAYSEEDFRRHQNWAMRLDGDPTPRQRLYRGLYEILRPLSQDERNEAIRTLRTMLGARATPRPERRPISPAELIELTEDGLIEVGAHTVTHPVLSTLSPARQREEIQQSKIQLEAIVGRPVTLFAYPYGSRRHYSAETPALIHEAGFRSACTTLEGLVGPGSDPWQLPRLIVRDWDGEMLSAVLDRVFGG